MPRDARDSPTPAVLRDARARERTRAMVGNHPQLSAALTSVQALNAAYAAHQREKLRGGDDDDDDERRRRKKEKKKRKKTSKEKKRKRERERGTKRRRRDGTSSSGTSSSASSSDERDERRSVREQVSRGRDAAEALRHMLAKFPSERESFRELLRAVDGGRGVATAGVADERVRKYLEYFFDNACLVRSSKTGAWALGDGDLSLSSRFGAVFDETPDALASLSRAREPWLGLDPEVVAAAKAKKDEARAAKRANAKPSTEIQVLTGEEAHAFMAERESDSERDEPKPSAPGPTQRPPASASADIGPSSRPPPVTSGADTDLSAKRVLGPMAPPKSMLEAAAADLAFDVTFGPPPPELVAEMESTSDESREACAMRLVRTLRRGGDAYDILGVSPEDTAGFIKKKYWKLSLMVHPDKCAHEDAKDAFDAIKKAHSALSDPTQRAVVDAKRNEANEREEFEQWLAGEREKAAWRRMKGTPLPGDDELLDGAKDDGNTRDEWMTHLPPEKRPNQGPPTANVTAFSKTEKVARTAEMEAAWTDTPQQAAEREKQLFLQAQEQQYALPAAKAKEEETKRLVEEFNATRRSKSLVEIHQERQRESTKREKKDKKDKKEKDRDKKRDDPNDGTNWEYRPFDRDTDLKLKKPGQLKPEEMLKRAGGGLGDRFRN